MTNTEKQIWELVHEWCNAQSCEIPDFNRRALMERILALRQPLVSGSLPPDELEKSLGSTNRQFTIWHDGGEWLISLKGKEQEQCKALREWLGGNDR